MLGSTDVGKCSSVKSLEVVLGHLLTPIFEEMVWGTVARSLKRWKGLLCREPEMVQVHLLRYIFREMV